MPNIPAAAMADRLRNPVAYARDPVKVLASTAERYGDIVRFMPPKSPFDVIMLNRAEWIHDVLERNAWNFQIVRVLTIDRALGQGLLTSNGYLHHHQRQLLAGPFHAWLPGATAMIARHAAQLRERWHAGETLDMRRAMLGLTVDVASEAAFGVDPAREPPALRAAGMTACQYLSRPSTHPLAAALEVAPVLRDNRRFWAAMRVFDDAVYRRIAARRAGDGEGDGLLSLLLHARDPESGAGLSDRQARDELVTLYTAGAGPMAWALARAWHLLCQNPEAEARLHAELDAVLAGRAPTFADVDQLAYTRMVIQETLRLYPSAWVFGRRVLSDYDLDGYPLPAGATVVMSSYVTQRDARYHPEPARFRPERWTPEEAAARPPGAYFPFGGGPRSCFGAPLAMLTMTTLLATLASNWRPRYVAGQPDAFEARFTLRLKHPLVMRLERRLPPPPNPPPRAGEGGWGEGARLPRGKDHPLTTSPNPRLRDLGVALGVGMPGPLNAITDVPGVRVGHTTLIRGEGAPREGAGPVRTGVTAIHPHEGAACLQMVPAAVDILNGAGEITGRTQIHEFGLLGSPLVLTNTLSVGEAYRAVLEWTTARHPGLGPHAWVAPVVAETWDGDLNDIAGQHVTREHVWAALDGAAGGPVAEGNVGGGTGMRLFGYKGGIGTASRALRIGDERWTLGVLVQGNFGATWQLLVDGVPVGRELLAEGWTRDGAPVEQTDGSCIVVIATDAPLSPLQLERVCRRGMLGLGQAGSMAHNGSGELLIAFSNAPANRVALDDDAVLLRETRLSDEWIDPVFEMTVEATTEAVLNAMIAAETMTGRDGHTVHALPHDRLRAIMRRHGRLRE